MGLSEGQEQLLEKIMNDPREQSISFNMLLKRFNASVCDCLGKEEIGSSHVLLLLDTVTAYLRKYFVYDKDVFESDFFEKAKMDQEGRHLVSKIKQEEERK